jgi:CRP-like cAMP-binding protein
MNLTDSLFRYLSQFITLGDVEREELLKIMKQKRMRKKEHFVRTGEICHKILFVGSGYFRFYHFHENGNEITSDFYFAPAFITSYTSLIMGRPSFVNVQSMDNTDVLELSKEKLYELYSKNPKIERLGRLIAEQVAINSERHLFLLLSQTAEARYKNLVDKYPEFIQNIPLQYIASYLGITRESLSRIRKSMG